MKILEIIQDHKGKLSKERIQTLIAALLGFVMMGVKWFQGKEFSENDLWLLLILFGYSVSAKSFQNITETMARRNETKG